MSRLLIAKLYDMIHVIDLHFLGMPEAIAAFLIANEAGLTLVETGPYSTFQSLENGINKAGYQIADVKHVLLTHIHLDHAGASWRFAQEGAQIYVHPFGQKHLHNPEKLMSSAKRIYQDQMDRLWGDMKAIPAEQLHVIEHEEVVKIGAMEFKAWHTPGHASHHIAWQLDNNLFAGDVAGVKIPGGIVVPPCPPPDIQVEDWQASIQLIRGLGISTMYLTHFGPFTNVEQHLDNLEQRLLSWAGWMKPHFEAGTSPDEIRPEFEAYALKELLDAGVSSDGLAKYNLANPSWMSVAGLLRYWKKKAAV